MRRLAAAGSLSAGGDRRGPAGLAAARERARKKASGRRGRGSAAARLSRGRRPPGPRRNRPRPPRALPQTPYSLLEIFPNFSNMLYHYNQSYPHKSIRNGTALLLRMRYPMSIFRMRLMLKVRRSCRNCRDMKSVRSMSLTFLFSQLTYTFLPS